MIYFLDNDLQLQKIVTSKNIVSAVHEHELNDLIIADIVLDLSYANKFLVLGIDHVGYYYKGEFYLHKIQSVEYNHTNETALVELRHVFFEDMLFGKLIQDVRPQNQDAPTVLRQTIDANTRWQTVMTDVTGRLSTNFYWQVPYEVIEFVTENYRVEYIPKILFDGQKINGFQLHVANKVGEDKNIRIPFGSRVLDLKYEEDYSEIITKLVGHGKGEEVGDGYGRRINISDVNFNRNGVESPVGDVYMEDETVTATYGNDGQTPREGRVIFEDIENVNELAEATYEHYLQVSRPQMLFTADVADIGDVGIGDSVMIIRREYDVYFKARIHKLTVDLLYPEDAQVELGDYEHFKESKIARKTREKNNRRHRQNSDRITRLIQDANDRFDGVVNQWKAEFEQVKIDIHALIEADRENMTNLIEGMRDGWTEEFMAEVEEIYKVARDNYDAIDQRITNEVDTTRTELENTINTSIDSAKQYAEQQAVEKSNEVKSVLESVTNGHQQMLDGLKDNVMNIDDFLGDKTVGLNEMLYNERIWFEEKLNNVDTWHYNMLRGSRFDENWWTAANGEIKTDEDIPYFSFDPNANSANMPFIQSTQEVVFREGETYRLSFDWQTYAVREVNYIFLIATPDDGGLNLGIWQPALHNQGTHLYTYWGSEYNRYWLEFSPQRTIKAYIRIGADMRTNALGRRPFKLRLPYLTTTENTRWLYHQLDSSQNIEEITRRITQLEDGREEFITRTQYDFETGEIEGSLKNIIETVDESTLIMQNHENWILTNGASIERTVAGFDSKAWLTDIHNPNMIPHSRFVDARNIEQWGNWSAPSLTKYGDEWLRVRNTNSGNNIGAISPKIPDKIIAGETYTITWEAFFNLSETRISSVFDYMYVVYSNNDNRGIGKPVIAGTKNVTVEGVVRLVNTYKLTFTAHHSDNNASILFGTSCQSGQDNWFFMRYPKLEVGKVSTPYFNAFSNLSQRADELMLSVQGIDMSGYLSQSDIIIRPEYAQMGSQRLDGSDIGAFLRVSPTGIDAVAEAMRLSGHLYVDGDITALALNAVNANISNIRTSILTANSITTGMLGANVVTSAKLRVDQALVNKLSANSIFTDMIMTKSLDAVDANIGHLRSAIITANVIEADHLAVGTQMVQKLFATSARIDQLITQTHFVNEMHALTLNVVELNASQIRARLLTANVIEAEWLKGGTALLDRVFSSTAMFERMMAKSGFVTTLNTVTIDTDLLTVRRKDGIAWIRDGMAQFDIPVQVQQYMDSDVEWSGQRYITNARGTQTVSMLYTSHAGRYLRIGLTTGMHYSSRDSSSRMAIVIRPQGSSPGTTMIQEVTATRSNNYAIYEIDLGRLTFGAASFSLEFYRIGDNVTNPVTLRVHRAWITG